MNAMQRFDASIRTMGATKFVMVMLALGYGATIPAMAFSFVTGIDLNSHAGPDINSEPLAIIFIATVLLAPLIETLVFQCIPIKLMQRIKRFSAFSIVSVSAVLFGLGHLYSVTYVILATGVGVVLAYAFIVCDSLGKRAYWYVASIHSLRNLMTFIFVTLFVKM